MPQTILIVDDVFGITSKMSQLACREGYYALTAPHGLEALRILKESPVDLLLTDLYMPHLGGEALVNIVYGRCNGYREEYVQDHFKGNHSAYAAFVERCMQLPTIIMSSGNDQRIARCLGAVGFLKKNARSPRHFDEAEFVALLGQYVPNRSYNHKPLVTGTNIITID